MPTNANTQTVSLRMPTTLVDRIDASALRDGKTRTDYILSWLPDYYDEPTRTTQADPTNNGHGSR